MSAGRSRERPGAATERLLDARLLALRRQYLRVEARPELLDAVRRAVRGAPRRPRRSRPATLGLAASLLLSFAVGAFQGAPRATSDGPAAVAAGREPDGRDADDRADSARAAADERFAALLASAAALPEPDDATTHSWAEALVDPDPDVRALARVLLRGGDDGR